MGTLERARTRADRRVRHQLLEFGSEVLEARVTAGVSQDRLGLSVGMSGTKIGLIEHGRLLSLTIADSAQLSAVLGLDLSVRVFPAGSPIRDAGQAKRLSTVLENVGSPLTYRTDVPLPQRPDQPTEMRAWDAMVYGHGARTGMELEARLRDVQRMTRRHAMKRRDDPVDNFLLIVADTPANRRVLREYADLLVDLPRLRTANVLRLLRAGIHPPTGLIVV